MPRRLLIKNAQCVFPDEIVRANVVVEGAKIASVDAPQTATADDVVDAHGLTLIPGVIDDQVHFREPGLTHKEDIHSGSAACAKGGITTFLEMPNTRPAATTEAMLLEKLARGAKTSLVNYGFYIGATSDNLTELQRASRTPGIKIFIGSSTGDLLVDDQETLETIFAKTTLPICAHCEDETTVRKNSAALNGGREVSDHSRIRDHAAALIATTRAVDLAVRHRHPFHVLHVSTAEEADFLRDHHQRIVTSEACVHHLLFNIDDYGRLGTLVQMNPSLKTEPDNQALWEALRNDQIQVVATDHAPHTLEEKRVPYPKSPSGLPAVENSLALMLDAASRGRCTIRQVVRWMCETPALVWNILDKGRIVAGYDADLVLVDLEKEAEVRNEDQVTKCGWSPWHGVRLRGWPCRTWVRGRLVFDRGHIDRDVHGEEALYDPARGGYWALLG